MHSNKTNMLLQKRDDPTVNFPSTGVTLAVIIIALLIFLVLLAISRIYFLRYRRSLAESGAIPMRRLYGAELPVPDISPPPVYVRKIDRFMYNKLHHNTTSWANMQPLSVTLDHRASSLISDEQKMSGSNNLEFQSINVFSIIQTSFLVSLPTPKSSFPYHLRRRTQPCDRVRTQDTDSTDPDTQVSKKNSAKHNDTASVAVGEQRRDTIVKLLERCAPGNQRTSEFIQNPSIQSTRMSANHETIQGNAKQMTNIEMADKDLGSFGLGIISFALPISDPSMSKEKESVKPSELNHVIDHAKQIQKLGTAII